MSETPISILFVDDAPEILLALKRMMRSSPWDVDFAEGGPAALELLEEKPFDVIVTDLNMPQINGVKLLKVVEQEYPHLIRIIYSGNLSRESIREVAPFTHRFIAKPCTVESMIQTIENTLFIHTVLNNTAIRTVLTNTGTIPSLPRIYQELMKQMDDPRFSLRDAARLISSDIGMSANILKQISLLGHAEEIRSIDQAVTMLGLDSIKAIVLSSHVFQALNLKPIPYFSAEDLTRHSMLTAQFAQTITLIETADRQLSESAFVAGVLHDLGVLLFAQNFPDQFGATLTRVHEAGRPMIEVERNLIGITHGEFGAYLLALWGFPRPVLTAVAFHEEPKTHETSSFTLLTAVYLASYLAHLFASDGLHDCFSDEGTAYLKAIQEDPRYETWYHRCREIYEVSAGSVVR